MTVFADIIGTGLAPADIGAAPATGSATYVTPASKTVTTPTVLPYFNVKDHGAKGDGSTDDTTAIQAAITACANAGGGTVIFPPAASAYIVTSTLNVTKTMKLSGSTLGNLFGVASPTQVNYTPTTGNLFNVTADSVVFEDLALVHPTGGGASTAGAAVYVDITAVATPSRNCKFTRVSCAFFFNGIDVENGLFWNATDCYFTSIVNAGIVARDTVATDAGDSSVNGCTFGAGSTYGILWTSGGGLRVVNTKLLANVGIALQVPDATNTSIILIEACSIENFTSLGVTLTQTGAGTGTLNKIVISGNEFLGGPGATAAISLQPTNNGLVSAVAISDNVFTGVPTSVTADRIAGMTIGPNTHGLGTTAPAGPIFLFGANMSNYHLDLASQVVAGDNVVIVQDTSGHVGLAGAQGVWQVERAIPGVTSNVTHTNVFTHTPVGSEGGYYEVSLSGVVQGVGGFAQRLVRSFLQGSPVTVATVGVDSTVGGLVDVQFDTATSPGKVSIGVRRNTGTEVDGVISLRVLGHAGVIKKGI